LSEVSWDARPWARTLGRLPSVWKAVLAIVILLGGGVWGGTIADLTLASAATFTRIFLVTLVFTGLGLVASALLGAALFELLAQRARGSATLAFWACVAANAASAVFSVVVTGAAARPAALAGALAGVSVGLAVAWSGWRASAQRAFGPPLKAT